MQKNNFTIARFIYNGDTPKIGGTVVHRAGDMLLFLQVIRNNPMNIITKTLIRIKAAIQDIPNGEFFLINGPIYLGIVIYFISVIILGPIFKGYGNVPQIYYGLIFIIFSLPLIMIGLFFAIKKRILPGARSVHMEGWPAVVVASVLFMMCLIAEIIWIWLLISPF